jgi:hypothetical protein
VEAGRAHHCINIANQIDQYCYQSILANIYLITSEAQTYLSRLRRDSVGADFQLVRKQKIVYSRLQKCPEKSGAWHPPKKKSNIVNLTTTLNRLTTKPLVSLNIVYNGNIY